MSLLALVLAASPGAPLPPPSPEVAQEIVVIGKQMKTWKGGISKVGGRMICKTSKSSGDRALDAIRCGAMLSCVKPVEPRIDALMASAVPRAEKSRRFQAIMTGLIPCYESTEAAAVERLARERAAA
jgi:hypothetical protein